MKTNAGTLAAPFPYFGGKSGACNQVWEAFGTVKNYVEPFCGSAAMLLGAPDGKRIETVNDADGFVANLWRSIAKCPEDVAHHADWPVNEIDLVARHSYLVRHAADLKTRMETDPDWFDVRMAGWWVWGACSWIGSGWCSGTGPWIHDGTAIVDRRKLPHLGDAGKGINRQLPHLSAGQGINKASGQQTRREFIDEWFLKLHQRLRDVRVTCGDWQRICKDSVTVRHGLTGVFLDPPYTKGDMQYTAGGVGTSLPLEVQAWCVANGGNPQLRIVLCGHAGEHDALLAHGWHTRTWTARKGYALKDDARANSAGETLWCSPHCVPLVAEAGLFAEAAQ